MSFDRNYDRSKTIGASEAGAVLGLSPFRSPLDVWLEKTGKKTSTGETKWSRLGNLLEPTVASLYTERTGIALEDPAKTYVHSDYVVSGTPDRIASDRVVEIKTAWTPRSQAAWGEEGSGDVPPHYLIQGAIYLALTGFDALDFAVFASGDLRIYSIVRDLDREREILTSLQEWWDRYVVPDVAPPISSSKDLDALKNRWSSASGEMLVAGPTVEAIARDYDLACRDVDLAQERADILKASLQAAIGPADGIESETFKATWKFSKESTRTDWEAIARSLSPSTELIRANTKTVAGSRRFLFKSKDGSK